MEEWNSDEMSGHRIGEMDVVLMMDERIFVYIEDWMAG